MRKITGTIVLGLALFTSAFAVTTYAIDSCWESCPAKGKNGCGLASCVTTDTSVECIYQLYCDNGDNFAIETGSEQ